jgi:hypothetical protein
MPNLIFPDKLIRVRAKESSMLELLWFVWFVLQSHPLRAQVEADARTDVGSFAIGGNGIWNFQIPLGCGILVTTILFEACVTIPFPEHRR